MTEGIMKFWQRAVLTTAGSVAYLSLPMLAWGGVGPFFMQPARVALVVVLLAAAFVALFAGGNLSPGIREDRSNRWVLAAFGIIGLLTAVIPAWTERLGLWTLDGDMLRWLGVMLFAFGCALRLWPVFVLGDRFSGLVAIQPGHTLVTTGIYGLIRNPSYLGLLVTMIGWALVFRSGAGLLLVALVLPPLVARIRAEERLLHEQFGVTYDAYRKRTWRLIPRVY